MIQTAGHVVDQAQAVLDLLADKGWTIATCESLTGGLLAAALIDPPGASTVVRGGLVTYATDLKATLADVPDDLLAAKGAVSSAVALAMAEGARVRCGADVGVATTGVAGPDPVGSVPVGTAWVAVCWPGGFQAQRALHPGDRAAVRAATVEMALGLVASCLGSSPAR